MTTHDRDENQPESFTRALGKKLRQEARSCWRWVSRGAIVGAVVLGGIASWYFGLTGLWIGAGIGAVCGGVGAFLIYGEATTGF